MNSASAQEKTWRVLQGTATFTWINAGGSVLQDLSGTTIMAGQNLLQKVAVALTVASAVGSG